MTFCIWGRPMSSFKPAVSVCLFLSCAAVAHAGNGDAPDQSAQRHQLEIQAQALAQIIKAADQICSTPPLTTSSDHLELNGQAQAALTGALKKITDLGISGAAKYTQGHSN